MNQDTRHGRLSADPATAEAAADGAVADGAAADSAAANRPPDDRPPGSRSAAVEGAAGVRPGKRPLWIVAALLAAAAAALWGASQLPWPQSAPAALTPLALVALAAIAGTLATSGRARQLVGILLALTGLAAGWVALDGLERGAAVFARGLALLAVVALWIAAIVLARAGHRMPKLGGSYQTPAAAKGNETPDKQLWRELSEGRDPTDG
ncbi:Trp biosynthesis-associated membrane protein [Actinocrispum sp. NPDC049592]|uniref:Trp biosynthesis-associated membrane protein n=1 Tax=Actinocrispum sp. NPDC049592 TaxID=3154835 RepID=UPI0034414042